MALAPSPLAPKAFPALPPVPGLRLATAATGLRYRGRDDLALFELAPGSTVAGVFTRNQVAGHPILWGRRILGGGRARALIVNAGNANVMIGPAGDVAVEAEAAAVAKLLGCRADEVFVGSTGVIGEPLPVGRIIEALPAMVRELRPDGWRAAAEAIRTTDTFAKGSAATARIGGAAVTIAGIAKGSGMIQPDMATMLAYIVTDAALPAAWLQALLERVNQRSFCAITVDSDSSTSDMLLAFATGQAEHPPPQGPDDPAFAEFALAFEQVAVDLAQQVVRDGEGATKLIEIRVAGAKDDASARRIGLSIANSPLVKTAIAGEDANWGRIAMAVGKAGEPVEVAALAIALGGVAVARGGRRVDGLDEAPVAAHLKGQEILIEVGVGGGPGQAKVWTCDLTHAYIDINASYRS